MRIKTLKNFEIESLTEAVKPEVGGIYRVDDPNMLGLKKSSEWEKFLVEQEKGIKSGEGLFYVKIVEKGSKWWTGKLIAANCLKDKKSSSGAYGRYAGGDFAPEYKLWDIKHIRIDKAKLLDPGPEMKIFQKAGVIEPEKPIMGKTFFLDGKEAGIEDLSGKAKTISEGEYIALGFNFAESVKRDEVIVYLVGKTKDEHFCLPYSSLSGTTDVKALSDDQRTVIGEWFASQMKGTITMDSEKKYRIKKYTVSCQKSGGYPSSFQAGPFVSEEQAKEIRDSILKMNKYSLFDPNEVKITEQTEWNGLTLDELISWAKSVGITTTMKELLVLRKGAVATKRFGI